MGVCSAVREAALGIDAVFGNDPRVRSAAHAVASMPHWLEQSRLDLWEEHVDEVVSFADHSSLPMDLIEEVFEFGKSNLYAAFQAEGTAQEFLRLAERLARHGVVLDDRQPVSTW